MPRLLFSTRLAADPAGCFVAIGESDDVTGAVFSIARGTFGWFGPLAVSPEAQGRGVGQALIAACLAGLRERGVLLVGLETFAESPFHVHLYSKFGFRPSWTGLGFRRKHRARADARPRHGERRAAKSRLRVRGHRRAHRSRRGGGARCRNHLRDRRGRRHLPLRSRPSEDSATGFVPFVAATSRPAFDDLLDAANTTVANSGLGVLSVRVPGSSWPNDRRPRGPRLPVGAGRAPHEARRATGLRPRRHLLRRQLAVRALPGTTVVPQENRTWRGVPAITRDRHSAPVGRHLRDQFRTVVVHAADPRVDGADGERAGGRRVQ